LYIKVDGYISEIERLDFNGLPRPTADFSVGIQQVFGKINVCAAIHHCSHKTHCMVSVYINFSAVSSAELKDSLLYGVGVVRNLNIVRVRVYGDGVGVSLRCNGVSVIRRFYGVRMVWYRYIVRVVADPY